MSDMVSVPAEKIAALREAMQNYDRAGISDYRAEALAAARAVVDAVETEDEPPPGQPLIEPWEAEDETVCTCGHSKGAHICHFNHNECIGCGCREFRTPVPSPARDEAEKAAEKAWDAMAEGHRLATTREGRITYIAGFVDGYMAAPDELTALREKNEKWAKDYMKVCHDLGGTELARQEIEAERDALREQLTALRVAVTKLATKHAIESDDLYATLGAGDA